MNIAPAECVGGPDDGVRFTVDGDAPPRTYVRPHLVVPEGWELRPGPDGALSMVATGDAPAGQRLAEVQPRYLEHAYVYDDSLIYDDRDGLTLLRYRYQGTL